MKLLPLFALILTVFSACNKSDRDVPASDPLYQKWKAVEIKSSNGNWEAVSYDGFLEFRADGSIANQKPACCSPVRFERQQQTLKVTEIYNGPGCEYVDCAAPSAYKIVSLSADELILEPVYGSTNPVSYNSIKYKPAK